MTAVIIIVVVIVVVGADVFVDDVVDDIVDDVDVGSHLSGCQDNRGSLSILQSYEFFSRSVPVSE